jgi:hypothetical protein
MKGWNHSMGRKIFVSYKYHDGNVFSLGNTLLSDLFGTTVRSYVDKLESYFTSTDIYKGESNDEDLSHLSDDAIWERLKDRIYDSSITIVMISPNMKETNKRDRSQWIPWEISYSLKEMTRNDRISRSNAMLAIVLPDGQNNYAYFIEEKNCCPKHCSTFKTDTLFGILQRNMFNQKNKTILECPKGITMYQGKCSYIPSVKWSNFCVGPQFYIDIAVSIKDRINDYEISKEV